MPEKLPWKGKGPKIERKRRTSEAATDPLNTKPVYAQGTNVADIKKTSPPSTGHRTYSRSPNNLRILGGTHRGMPIDSPPVYLRPMMAKVRQALFSSLASLGVFANRGCRVLDVFSGAGSVGLEALSRGAAHATFVDLAPECAQTCVANARRLGVGDRAAAVCASALDVLAKPQEHLALPAQPFDLVTLTPPYALDYSQLVRALAVSPLLCEGTVCAIEYPLQLCMPFALGEGTTIRKTGAAEGTLATAQEGADEDTIAGGCSLFGVRNRRYGRTAVALYVCRPSEAAELRPGEFARMS